MRLQPKIEVNNLVASQRKIQIDEGVRIAQRVDALRETLASLEAQHSKFIEGMEGELRRRTNHLIANISDLEKDIIDLEDKRRFLQIPLDDKWREINQKIGEISQFKANLEKKEAKLIEKELIQDGRDRKSKELMVRVKSRDKASIKANDESEQLKTESEKIKVELLASKLAQEESFEKKSKELDERENSLISYTFTLTRREEEIEFHEQEIRNEKVRLTDQRQTLERAMARLKK